VRVPDSRVAREAEELVREAAPDFLTNHSFRSYAWSVALADRDDVRYDAELLYVAALLHDIGLVAQFDQGGSFEDDGAVAAARFAVEEGWTAERRDALAEAIRLHMAAEIALEDGPEAYLLWHATGLDVRGHRLGEIDPRDVAAALASYPRLDFKRGFAELFADQAERKPDCQVAKLMRSGFADRIAAAPFES
jgi:HD domain-containing protein